MGPLDGDKDDRDPFKITKEKFPDDYEAVQNRRWETSASTRDGIEVLAAMSWCDVFSLASWGEASGTVYGEVMQFDKPVIACEGEGIADIVRDGVHGRLVPARDEHRLAEALQWLLADAGRLGQLGRQARALCEARLSYPTLARTLSGLYSDIVAGIPLRK